MGNRRQEIKIRAKINKIRSSKNKIEKINKIKGGYLKRSIKFKTFARLTKGKKPLKLL